MTDPSVVEKVGQDETPTYLGALQAFNPYEPHYVELETDDDGRGRPLHLRMNFTAADPETIGRAVSIIGAVMAEELGARV